MIFMIFISWHSVIIEMSSNQFEFFILYSIGICCSLLLAILIHNKNEERFKSYLDSRKYLAEILSSRTM